jgi:hypothetical protein
VSHRFQVPQFLGFFGEKEGAPASCPLIGDSSPKNAENADRDDSRSGPLAAGSRK